MIEMQITKPEELYGEFLGTWHIVMVPKEENSRTLFRPDIRR